MRYLTILFLVLCLAGCSRQKPVSYRGQIQPILDKRCVPCHSVETHRARIVLTSYEKVSTSRALITGRQPLIVPGNPVESRLYVLCATSQTHFRMPPDTAGMPPVTTEELELVRKWIEQGAQDN